MKKAIPDAVEVKGSDKDEYKKQSLLDFANGKIRVLITKPKIAGLGMNFQVCHNTIFTGLSDSYEEYYQAIRRVWRFGQKSQVNTYIVISDREGAVLKNIQRKEQDAMTMAGEMVKFMHVFNEKSLKGDTRMKQELIERVKEGDGWKCYQGDTVKIHQEQIPDNHYDYSIFSPPFAQLYTYSDSDYDMGNCTSRSEFYEQYKFLVQEQFRTIKPGRLLSFHCMNLPLSKQNDGHIGQVDFRGELIRMYQDAGFIYHSEVVIWKNPVVAMQRTKSIGLLHKQLVKDSTISRQGIPDYIITMRKPGNNSCPVAGELDHYEGEIPPQIGDRMSIDIWQQYASPVWMDINPSDTLQYRAAKDKDDQKHICPLQLSVIHRCLQLWTNPGDLVCDPFGGIGSTGWEAIKMGRKVEMMELKTSYYKQMILNMRTARPERKLI